MGNNPSQVGGAAAMAGVGRYNNHHRPRSVAEDIARAATIATGPVGAVGVATSEIAEANGHMTRKRFEGYNRANIMRHKDPRERAFDAMKRATDPGP